MPRVSTLAAILIPSLLWAAVLGFVIWGDLPGGWVWAGAAILVVSGLWIAQTEKT